jgi:hypothetical protein
LLFAGDRLVGGNAAGGMSSVILEGILQLNQWINQMRILRNMVAISVYTIPIRMVDQTTTNQPNKSAISDDSHGNEMRRGGGALL